jgi:hypothetical protein
MTRREKLVMALGCVAAVGPRRTAASVDRFPGRCNTVFWTGGPGDFVGPCFENLELFKMVSGTRRGCICDVNFSGFVSDGCRDADVDADSKKVLPVHYAAELLVV